jgi:hypothetical protein
MDSGASDEFKRPPALWAAIVPWAKRFCLWHLRRLEAAVGREIVIASHLRTEGVDRQGRAASWQVSQVVPDVFNVWRLLEVADDSLPTDRPHLAAFILPS